MRISAVVLTQDNALTIRRCLDSVSFADEIIVVDSFSKDGTAGICKGFTKKFFQKKFVATALSRNFGLKKAKNDWVFFIDSDEELSEELVQSIKDFSPVPEAAACSVLIKTNYLGAWMKSRALSQRQPRLFRKGKAAWSNRLCHALPEIDGKIAEFQGCLLHHSIQSVLEHLKKIDYYSTLEAKQRKLQNCADSVFLFPFKLVTSSSLVFLKRTFAEMAFLDGWRGIVFSLLSAYYEIVADFKFFLKKY